MKNKFRVVLFVAAILIIIAELTTVIDYSNLSWSKNLGPYLTILGMIFLIISLISTIRHDKKQQSKLKDISR